MTSESPKMPSKKKCSNLGPDMPERYIMSSRTPLSSRIGYFFKLWTAKIIFGLVVNLIKRKRKNITAIQPSLVKSYACRPQLPVRIFLPESSEDRGEKKQLKPLFINIHGGGFAVGDASLDDRFCAPWRDRTGMIVVSLNYHKAPRYRFPVALHDIAEVARSIIEDSSLPIDKSRVTIAGFSAGANLALTASQLPELHGIIKAAVVWYPVVDWSVDTTGKWETRLSKVWSYEPLAMVARSIDWGYVPAGQDRTDPLLSPWYVEKEDLPKNICFVTAQHDLLCREARDMACLLSGKRAEETNWEDGFEAGPIKFMMIKNERHGFVDDWVYSDADGSRAKICAEMYASIDRWLQNKGLMD